MKMREVEARLGYKRVIKEVWKGDSGLFSAQVVIKGESVKQVI
jgi:hypothetical protein